MIIQSNLFLFYLWKNILQYFLSVPEKKKNLPTVGTRIRDATTAAWCPAIELLFIMMKALCSYVMDPIPLDCKFPVSFPFKLLFHSAGQIPPPLPSPPPSTADLPSQYSTVAGIEHEFEAAPYSQAYLGLDI